MGEDLLDISFDFWSSNQGFIFVHTFFLVLSLGLQIGHFPKFFRVFDPLIFPLKWVNPIRPRMARSGGKLMTRQWSLRCNPRWPLRNRLRNSPRHQHDDGKPRGRPTARATQMWCCRWRATGSIGSKGSPKVTKVTEVERGRLNGRATRAKAKPVEKVEMDVARVKVPKVINKVINKVTNLNIIAPVAQLAPFLVSQVALFVNRKRQTSDPRCTSTCTWTVRRCLAVPRPGDPLRNCSRRRHRRHRKRRVWGFAPRWRQRSSRRRRRGKIGETKTTLNQIIQWIRWIRWIRWRWRWNQKSTCANRNCLEHLVVGLGIQTTRIHPDPRSSHPKLQLQQLQLQLPLPRAKWPKCYSPVPSVCPENDLMNDLMSLMSFLQIPNPPDFQLRFQWLDELVTSVFFCQNLDVSHIFSKCFWLFSSSFSMTPGEKGGRRLHHGPGGQHAAAVVNVNSDVVVGVGLRLGAGGDGWTETTATTQGGSERGRLGWGLVMPEIYARKIARMRWVLKRYAGTEYLDRDDGIGLKLFGRFFWLEMVELLNHNGASANWVMKTPVVGGVFRPCDPEKKGISMAMAKPMGPKNGFLHLEDIQESPDHPVSLLSFPMKNMKNMAILCHLNVAEGLLLFNILGLSVWCNLAGTGWIKYQWFS